MKAFKIMDLEGGKLKTLFHGNHGSRTLPQWTWIKAQVRENAVDGGSGPEYRSGFHVMSTLAEAKAYLKRFKNMATKVIVSCEVAGNIWKKPQSPAEGLCLCDEMKLGGIVWINVDLLFSNEGRK
jgi:hypothetical protein